jgi:hypothetical protein
MENAQALFGSESVNNFGTITGDEPLARLLSGLPTDGALALTSVAYTNATLLTQSAGSTLLALAPGIDNFVSGTGEFPGRSGRTGVNGGVNVSSQSVRPASAVAAVGSRMVTATMPV